MHTSTQFLCFPSLETVINKDFLAVSPETSVVEALNLMSQGQLSLTKNCALPKYSLSGNQNCLSQCSNGVTTQLKTKFVSPEVIKAQSLPTCALVIQEQQLMGIFSVEQLPWLVTSGQDLNCLQLAQVINPHLAYLELCPQEDIWSALSLIKEHKLNYLPVVNSQKQPLGIVSYETICQALKPYNWQDPQEINPVNQKQIDCFYPIEEQVLNFSEQEKAQEQLEQVNAALEAIVDERTAALHESNKYLRSEIVKRFSLTRKLKQSQDQLRETTMLQQAILDSANYSVIATSPTGIILTFNQAAQNLLGYKASEVVGRFTPGVFHNPQEIEWRCQELLTQGETDLKPGFDVVVAKARGEEVEEREWTYIRKDGTNFPVVLSVTALRNRLGKLSGFLVIGRDITASKQAEENLRLRERAIAASDNGIVITDATQPGMPIIYANPAFEAITGYSPREVMGLNFSFLQGDETDQSELAVLKQALKNNCSCTVVLRNYRKDGTPFWNELSMSPIYDGQGNLTHYIAIQKDITDRRNAMEELSQAKAQLRAVLDAVPGMVSWIDSDSCYLGVNRHLAHTYNLPPESFVGQPVNFLHSSDEFSRLIRHFFTIRAQKVRRRIRAKVDGEEKTYLVAAQKYQQGNAAVSVGIDITALRQTEDELRAATSRLSALIENLQAGVMVEDESGRVVLINQVFCDIFDIPMIPASLIGADLSNFAQEYQQHFAQPEQFSHRYQAILEAKVAITDEEIQLADGRTFELDYVPIIVAGNYCGHLWMYSDITARKRSEAEMHQALQREKELGELKSRFVTNTSHEFRTPLTAILSSSELLEHYRHQWTEEKQTIHIHRIQKSVKHMTQLLNDILIIGKAEAGRLEFKPKLLNLAQFCRELAEELQLNSQNNHKICLNYQSKCTQVFLDEKLLRHILTNLLANAMKYSPGESTINFFVACQDSQAIFNVQDQGIGIPEEDQIHLFESFHRATNVGNIQGTGLGLSIVKKCVEVHGGDIWVNSQVDQGTTFTLTLPINC